jgi:hypothetical protein
MLYRIQKGVVTTAHLGLLVLFVLTVSSELPWPAATCYLIISGAWLVLTAVRLPQLLRSFEDRVARMQVMIPGLFGLAATLLAVAAARWWAPVMVAVVELLGWGAVYSNFDKRSKHFMVQGHGPLPDDTWMSPDLETLQEGDLILTDGRMAARTRNSVGHVELIVKGRDGKLKSFSSYMEKGVVMHTLRALIALERRLKQHYIVIRLRQPFTPEQSARATEVALAMLARNAAWRKAAVARRTAMVARLPLPESWRQTLLAKTMPTGYDWSGQYTGFVHQNRWTCMGACLAVLKEVGVETHEYGTGLLGLGTGLLNPLMPIRLVRDPAYRLLRHADKELYDMECSERTAGAATASASKAAPDDNPKTDS